MPAGFRRHLVGKTLEAFVIVLLLKYAFWEVIDHVDIFLKLTG